MRAVVRRSGWFSRFLRTSGVLGLLSDITNGLWLFAPRALCARVFVLAREWSSWKLDPTALPWPPPHVRSRSVRRCPPRSLAPQVLRARVFALAREGSSWKLDPTTSSRLLLLVRRPVRSRATLRCPPRSLAPQAPPHPSARAPRALDLRVRALRFAPRAQP